MADYLNRDDVLNNTDIITVQTREYGTIDVVPVEYLADLPTADVVKRPCTCSECKHFKIINFMTKKNEPALAECQKQGITFFLLVAEPKEHFCRYGERKDDNDV